MGAPTPWKDVPDNARRLLTAVSAEIAARFGPVVAVDTTAVVATLGWHDICRVIEAAGWRPAGGIDGSYRRYYWPGPSVEARLIVPVDRTMADYDHLVKEMLWTLRQTARTGADAGTVLAGLTTAVEQKKTVPS